MTPLEAILRSEGTLFVLEVARITGVLVGAPLPWAQVPTRVRAVLVLVLAVVAHSQVPVAPVDLAALAFVVPVEFLVGFAMGFVVRLSVATAEVMASTVAPVIGFGGAQVFDPQTSASETVLTTLVRNIAILLALVVGVHRVLLGALLASFQLLPPGSAISPGASAETLLGLSVEVLHGGLRMALPILAVLFVVQLALAFVSRAAPAMQIFSVGFAVTLGVGTVVLFLAAPDLLQEVLVDLSQVGVRIETVLWTMRGA